MLATNLLGKTLSSLQTFMLLICTKAIASVLVVPRRHRRAVLRIQAYPKEMVPALVKDEALKLLGSVKG